jgi:hypothetical protein
VFVAALVVAVVVTVVVVAVCCRCVCVCVFFPLKSSNVAHVVRSAAAAGVVTGANGGALGKCAG